MLVSRVAVAAGIAAVAAAVATLPAGGAPSAGETAAAEEPFVVGVRTYGLLTHEEFELRELRELGAPFFQPAGYAAFDWRNIEPRQNEFKWGWADGLMARAERHGLKVIPFVHVPKEVYLHYEVEGRRIRRDNKLFAARFGNFARAVTEKYKNDPAWSGIVAVWGGSSDVYFEPGEDCRTEELWYQRPALQVRLLNAAYDGIKAESGTIVVGFNLQTTFPCSTPELWESWHRRAFELGPRFDWFGVQTHGGAPTMRNTGMAYAGVPGLVSVRRFLDRYPAHRGKPIFVNEGGFIVGTDVGGLDEQTQAEFAVESYVVVRTLGANVRGWIYFVNFVAEHANPDRDWGLMSSLDQHDPPQPRVAWYALQTLIRTVRFFDYRFEAKLQGEFDSTEPFVYRFGLRARPGSKLWVIFSPRLPKRAEPEVVRVPVDISPARTAVEINMRGHEWRRTADAFGLVRVKSTSSPVLLRVGKPPAGKPAAGPRPAPPKTKPGPVKRPPPPAKGAAYSLEALLTPGAVVPPAKGSGASGSFRATLSADGTLAWKLSLQGLGGSASAAHLHAGGRGKAGKVVADLCKACASEGSGKVKLRAALLKALLAGGEGEAPFYVNVHTAAHPEGELRGQLSLG